MLKEGLYCVQFQTPRGAGAGVVVLEGGRIRGGDARIFYTGTYSENGDQFTAQVRTDAHTNTPNAGSVFGPDKLNISLRGTSSGNAATLSGNAAEAPSVGFHATLRRIGD